MTAPEQQYTRVAALLHWMIALFILFNLSLGFFMEGFRPPLKFIILTLHFSAGITVLALTVLRVFWRLIHEPPAHDPPLKAWEKHLSHIVHFLLYCGMVLMPITGWAIISAHPAPGTTGFAAEQASIEASLSPGEQRPPASGPKLWWVAPLPSLAPIENVGATPGGLAAQDELHDEFVEWHKLGGFIMIALLVLHLGGAIKHQFIDRNPVLMRMSLRRR